MKKTYFLDSVPTSDEVLAWIARYDQKQIEKAKAREIENQRAAKRAAFVKKYGTRFSRLRTAPKFSIVNYSEMQGKYGWFTVESHHDYNLTEYHSGVSFKSQRSLDKYRSI